MTRVKIPTLDQYWEGLATQLPRFSPEEQRAAVALYRELAKGRAVDAAQLGRALRASPAEGRALLARDSIKAFVYPDDQGRVLGFGGLAAAPMHHRFEVDGRTLWTWCAWDSLFIPEVLGRSARVESANPENGKIVRLLVSPDRIESAEPESAVVSFLLPDAHDFDTSAANVMAKFCHFVFFFTSRTSGELWVAKHPRTFLYSLDEAFALAKRLNARNFGTELARQASSGLAMQPTAEQCCHA
jgi:alkylmercury lyase